jgi:hypothetical protein
MVEHLMNGGGEGQLPGLRVDVSYWRRDMASGLNVARSTW